MNKKYFTISLIVLVVLIIVGGIMFWFKSREVSTITEQVANMDIKTFSLNGTVTKLEPNKIYFKTGSVQKTSEGNKFVEEEKIVLVNSSTVFNKTGVTISYSFNDLKVDESITVYTAQNPFDQYEIIATKILIGN